MKPGDKSSGFISNEDMKFRQQKTHLCKWVMKNNNLHDNQLVIQVVSGDEY